MYYSKEDIQRANSVDLAAYFRNRGYTCEKKGKDIHIRGLGGLYVNITDNTYYCFSQQKGGNAVNCLCDVLNIPFTEAVKELLGESPVYNTVNVKSEDGKAKKDKEKCTLEMPECADNYKRVFAYLSKTRKIDPDIIKALIDEKVLYRDKRGNAVFVHLDKNGQAVGAEITGTLTYNRFKGIATGTSESVFKIFKGEPEMKPDTAYIFESAIDMLSFIQLHPDITNAEFVSMAGLKDYLYRPS